MSTTYAFLLTTVLLADFALPLSAETDNLTCRLGSEEFKDRHTASKASDLAGGLALDYLRAAAETGDDAEVRPMAKEAIRRTNATTAIEKLDTQVHKGLRFDVELRDTDVTEEVLKNLKELKGLQSLSLSGPVTDDGLKRVKELSQLRALRLINTQTTDAGLKELKTLRILILETRVTDAILKVIKELECLEELTIDAALLTDAGINELRKVTKLKRLTLLRPW